MKNLFTSCFQYIGNIFNRCSGSTKAFIVVLFFAAVYHSAKAQVAPPACNIVGPLTACAIHNPNDTSQDFIIYVEVARSTAHSTISYSFASNTSGAFIRKDLHGTILIPHSTATGLTIARANGVYDSAADYTYDTLEVFPGSMGYEFNLQVDDTTLDTTNNSCECSKSVSVAMIFATALYDTIPCFGGTTTLTVNSFGSGNSMYDDSLFVAGQFTLGEPNPDSGTATFPGITAGNYMLHVYSPTDMCAYDTSINIHQAPYNPLVLNCAHNDTVSSCQTQAAVHSEFLAWLNTAFTTGGTNTVLTNNSDNIAPAACGGSVTVTFTATSSCDATQTCSGTFTVTTAPSVSLTAPANDSVASCQTQAAVNAEFAAWLATFTYSGGCNATSGNNNTGAPAACGGTTTVDFTVTSSCADAQTVSANFTVRAAPSISLTAPANDTVASCQTQAAVNAEFNSWLATFGYSGGCNVTTGNNSTGAPSACGGTTTVDFTVTSSCADIQTVSANFTVHTAPSISLTAPANDTIASCQTQAAVDSEFTTWLATFSYSGGCNVTASNNSTGAPSSCGGTTTVDFTVVSSCADTQTVSANFTVPVTPPFSLHIPANDTLTSCLSQASVDSQFTAWLNSASVSGSCGTSVINNYNTDHPIPSSCGGSVTIAFSATSVCRGIDATENATFTVKQAPSVSLTAPANDTVTSCQTQAAVNAEFATWLATFSYSGGCNGTSSNNNTGAPAACGGTTTVDFTVASSCADTQTVSANFTVRSAPSISLTAPANDTVTSCQTQAAVNAEFATWLATFSHSGGCNVTSSNNNTGAPLACGGTTTVDFTVASSCADTQTVSANFTVRSAPAISLTTPANDTIASCQTQAAVNLEFNAWLATASVSGGCSASLVNSGYYTDSGTPPACGTTGFDGVEFTATDNCGQTVYAYGYFVVPVAPSLSLTAPANDTVASCQTQTAVNAEFAAWLASFSYSGGCHPTSSNNNTGAPSACGGTTTVDFTVISSCADTQTVSANFTVHSAPSVSLTAPSNDTVTSCQTQAAVNAEFATWLATFSYSGGCNVTLGNNNTGAPSACGGSATVDFTVTSTCADPQTVSANFTVTTAPSLSLTAPANDTVASCQTQAAVDTEFAAWLAGFSHSGGCGSSSSSPGSCTSFDEYLIASPDSEDAAFELFGNGNPGFLQDWEVTNGTPSVWNQSRSAGLAYNGTQYALMGVDNTVDGEGVDVKYNFQAGQSYTIAFARRNAGAPGTNLRVDYVLLDSSLNYVYNYNIGSSAIPAIPASGLTVYTDNDLIGGGSTGAWQVIAITTPVLAKSYNRLWFRPSWTASVQQEVLYLLDSVCISSNTPSNNLGDTYSSPSACGGNITVDYTVNSTCSGSQTVSASFAVPSAPSVSLTTPANDTVTSCQTQAAVDSEFTAWLATFGYSGGCSATSSNNNTGAPLACGGTTTVDFTVTSSCADIQTVSSNFTVLSAPSVSLTAPANDTIASCQSQATVDSEFTAWLAEFSYRGGCNITASNNNTGAPSACGGSTTAAFTVNGSCANAQTVSSNFTVRAAPSVTLTVPANDTVAKCQTQDQVNAEFATWLASASISGGCGTVLSNNYNTDNGTPSACGGSMTITFTANSNCQGAVTKSATFMVPSAPTLSLTSAANDTVAACQSQAVVNSEFNTWLSGFTYTGGCNASSSNNNNGAPAACGGSTTVVYTVTSTCANPQTASASFTVRAAPSLSLTAPANDTVASCQTQTAVNAEFATWLATFSYSGGCNASSSNNNTGAPAACGGTTTVDFTVASLCGDTQTVSANFTVPVTPPFTLNIPANDTVASCQSQAAVDAEFTAWLNSASVSGSCGTSVINNYNSDHPIPSACGGSVTISFTATSVCRGIGITEIATFTVAPSLPIVLTAPANDTVSSCQTQAAVDAEYATWLATFSYSGGCNATSGNNSTGAPAACGGTTTVDFKVASSCADTQTVSANFTVPSAPSLSITTPANDTVSSCQLQAAVDSEYAVWLGTFSFSGGCNASSSNNSTGAPLACGGTTTVNYTVASTCANNETVTAMFVVPSSTSATLRAPANDTVASCQTQAAVDAEFATWLATFSYSGGCNITTSNNNTGAPSACGGSTTVAFTVNGSCANSQTVSANFTVPAAPLVTLTVPANDTVTKCQTQAQVNAEFATWLASASISGGCGTVLSNNYNTDNGTPSACGGSLTITFTANSNCQGAVTKSATFMVPSAPTLSLTSAANDTVAACQSQAAVNSEFNTWLSGFTYTGGCNASSSNNNTGAPAACGGSTTVVYTVTSSCANPQTVSASFTVRAAPSLSLTAPANDTVAGCQTQAQVNAEFATWLATFNYSGGCDVTSSNNNTGAPSSCGGSTTVNFTVNSSCSATQIVNATFTVPTGMPASITVANDTVTTCQTQEQVDSEFDAWLNSAITSGGCVSQVTNDFDPDFEDVPSVCGGSLTVSFTVSSCSNTQTVSATFVVPTAPDLFVGIQPNDTVEPCQTQAQVNAEFAAWIAGFSYFGGCNPSVTISNNNAPSACGGTVDVIWTISSSCLETEQETSIFVVRPSEEPLVLNVPANDTVVACQTQGQVNAEFTTWLNSASASGGCSAAVLTNNYNANNGTPSACGGTLSVTFTATSSCGSESKTVSFTVSPSTPVSLNSPGNETVAQGQTQAEVNAEFNVWLNSASANGGCGTTVSNNYNSNNGIPSSCGGSITVTFTATSNCQSPVSASVTFTVPSLPNVTITASNDTVNSCQSQSVVNVEFSAWLASASTSGGGQLTHSYNGTPQACGGTITVTYTATGGCGGPVTKTVTFTVLPGPVLTLGACSHTSPNCNGNSNTGSVSAGVVSNSCGPVSYSWANAAGNVVGTTAMVNYLAPGTYTLTVSDNCHSATCSQTIIQASILTMGECSSINASCNSSCTRNNTGSVSAGAITGNNGPVSYIWVNDANNEAVGTTATVSGLPGGTYTLTASDNCSSVTCSVTISSPPIMTMGACSSSSASCNSNTGSVSAGAISNNNGPVSYIWVNDANSQVIGTKATVSGLPAGTYTLTASDNCSSVTCSETISPAAALTMGACSSNNASCNANCNRDNTGSVSAGAISSSNGPVSYSWVNSSDRVVGTTATVSGLPVGTYTLTASDNCSSVTCSVTISSPAMMTMGACSSSNLNCEHGSTGSVSAGAISNNNGHVSYIWINDANSQVVGTTATVSGLPAGTYTLTASDNCSSATCSETISPAAALTMGACSSSNASCNASCNRDNTGSVSAGAITNNNGLVSYSWVNSSYHVVGTTATVSGLPIGTYTLTASDNCSSVTCSETISSPPMMAMGGCSSSNLSCNSSCSHGNTGSVSAGAITNNNGHVSYIWVNEANNEAVGTTATVSGLPAGTYTLTASDNCSSVTCSVSISSPAAMNMGECSSTNSNCSSTGSVSAGAITNNNGSVSYSWVNSSNRVVGTTATVSGLPAGTYTLTASDNCSSLTCSVSISSHSSLTMAECSSSNASCNASCTRNNTGSVSAGAISNNNGAVSYRWVNSSNQAVGTTATVSGLPIGTYTLTASDNCSSVTCSVSISSPAAMTMGECSSTNASCNASCNRDNTGSVSAGAITNNNGAVSYSWVNDANHEVVGSTANVSGLPTGTYTLTASDNCSSVTCSVSISSPAAMSMAACSETNTSCGACNGSVSAGVITNANGAVSYSWVNASNQVVGTTATVSGLAAGTYYLTASDNCSSATCSETVSSSGSISCSITSEPSGGCTSTGGNPNAIYLGYGPQSTQLVSSVEGNGPFTYTWSPATGLSSTTSASPVFTPTSGGIYTFTLTVTSGGCSTTCEITICVLDIRVPASSCGKQNYGNVVYLCQNSQSIEVNVSLVAHDFANGYELGQCNQSCNQYKLDMNVSNLTANEGSAGFAISVYPNPFSSQFHLVIQSESSEPIDMKMLTVTGQMINQMNDVQANTEILIGNQFASGVYFVEVTQGDVRKVLRMVKAE